MSGKKTIFIHIGYPKTATSTIQQHLFQNLKEIDYFGKIDNIKFKFPKMKEYLRDIANKENNYNHNKDNIREFMQNIMKQSDKNILLSEENFTAYAFGFNHIKLTLARLNEVFQNDEYEIKLIITIRNQLDFILSAFSFFDYGYTFKNFLEDNFKTIVDNNISSNLCYDRILKEAKTIFGDKNILVLKYEDFVSNRKKFVDSLSYFLELDNTKVYKLLDSKWENKGNKSSDKTYSKKISSFSLFMPLIKVKRYFFPNIQFSKNKVIQRLFKVLYSFKIKDEVIEFDNFWEKHLKNLYMESNKNLDEMLKNI